MGEENSQFQSHISNLESDLDELITLIRKARTTGKWEVSISFLFVIVYLAILCFSVSVFCVCFFVPAFLCSCVPASIHSCFCVTALLSFCVSLFICSSVH